MSHKSHLYATAQAAASKTVDIELAVDGMRVEFAVETTAARALAAMLVCACEEAEDPQYQAALCPGGQA